MLRTSLKPHLKYAFTYCYKKFISQLITRDKKIAIFGGSPDSFTRRLLMPYNIVHPIIAVRATRDMRKVMLLQRKTHKFIIFWQ